MLAPLFLFIPQQPAVPMLALQDFLASVMAVPLHFIPAGLALALGTLASAPGACGYLTFTVQQHSTQRLLSRVPCPSPVRFARQISTHSLPRSQTSAPLRHFNTKPAYMKSRKQCMPQLRLPCTHARCVSR